MSSLKGDNCCVCARDKEGEVAGGSYGVQEDAGVATPRTERDAQLQFLPWPRRRLRLSSTGT